MLVVCVKPWSPGRDASPSREFLWFPQQFTGTRPVMLLGGERYISLLILTFLNRRISVKTSLINTKLGNLVILGVLFLTMWINSY